MARYDPVDLAKVAYTAYGGVTGGKNHRGEPMPDWADLGDTIQDAWTAAAIAVVRSAKPGGSVTDIESPAERSASAGTENPERSAQGIASDAFYEALGGRPPRPED